MGIAFATAITYHHIILLADARICFRYLAVGDLSITATANTSVDAVGYAVLRPAWSLLREHLRVGVFTIAIFAGRVVLPEVEGEAG
jgi:hypothetical protein